MTGGSVVGGILPKGDVINEQKDYAVSSLQTSGNVMYITMSVNHWRVTRSKDFTLQISNWDSLQTDALLSDTLQMNTVHTLQNIIFRKTDLVPCDQNN